MEIISSRQNPFVKQIKSLALKKNRDTLGLFLVDGLRIVEEAIGSGAKIRTLVISKSFHEQHAFSHAASAPVLAYMDANRASDRDHGGVIILEDSIQKSISDTETSQGIMALIKKPEFPGDNAGLLSDGPELFFDSAKVLSEALSYDSFVVVLDKLQDPGNVGTIIRTAHAGGADCVFLSDDCVDLYNPKTLRASMGSVFHVPVISGGSAADIVLRLKERGFATIASHLDGDRSMFNGDFSGKVAIVIGNEGNGISDEVTALCDYLVKIPMPGGAESLNASVAAGLLIYEATRARNRHA